MTTATWRMIWLATLGAALALGGAVAWSATQPSPSAHPAAVAVSSIAELTRALEGARDGDVIELTAGRYPPALIRRVRVDGMVTIRPARRAQVVLAGLDLRDVAGLTLSGLTFRGDPAPGRYQLSVTRGERVRLEGLRLDGPTDDGERRVISSVMLRDVRDAVVRGSLFTGGWHGLSLLNVDGLVVEDNGFRGLQTDGVRGGGVNHAVIARNSFTDFHPRDGDHPDGIQLWSTQQDAAARDIVIRKNLVVRGDGGGTQGVFVRDTKLKLPFEGLVIRDNLVIGGLYNGITVSGARAPVVEGNVVMAYPDQDSWIRLTDSTDAVLRDNAAFKFVDAKTRFVTRTNNRTIATGSPKDVDDAIRAWLSRTGRVAADGDPVLRALADDD